MCCHMAAYERLDDVGSLCGGWTWIMTLWGQVEWEVLWGPLMPFWLLESFTVRERE